MSKIWTVSELSGEISRTLESRSDFQNCWISGEITNFKHHKPSGHWYFSLKDEYSSLRGVMFRSRASHAGFMPQDGMKVLARGSVRIYERDGNIQFYVDEIQPSGIGTLYLAFEQLKQRLDMEGLFDPARKKKIPANPRRIGIVTSSSGAALRDIINIMERRHPRMSWLLCPAAVQGESAPSEVAQAIERLNRYGNVDVLIVGRGGGSLEELWAFNTEEVARAIAASRIPVISAVGHETDITIADYVADLRAPTPSAAAELAVPLLREMEIKIKNLAQDLYGAMKLQLERKNEKLKSIADRTPLKDPYWRVEQNRLALDSLHSRLGDSMTRFVSDKNGILKLLAAKLDLLSPLAILDRGYSLAYRENGNIIRTVKEVAKNEDISVKLAEGKLYCRVIEKEN